MGTAVLRETDVFLGEEDVRHGEEGVLADGHQVLYDGTGIEVGGEEWSKMGLIMRSAHLQWLKGEEVYVANEPDDLDIDKYLSADMLKYLDSVELDENWRTKDGKVNFSKVN